MTLYGGFGGTETALEGRDWSAHLTTLSGDLGTFDDSSDNAYTVVYCGEDVEAGVDGVWIVDGMADGSYSSTYPERGYGGGIYCYRGTLTVTNSTLLGNSAGSGGGISSDSGTLTVTNSTFSGNSASSGGGIYNDYGTLMVTNSTLSGNSAESGGGICSYCIHHGTVTVTNSTLSGNSARDGGGICSLGTLTVTNSTLSGNSTDLGGGGGGIYCSGTLTVTNSTFSGNSAAWGGGIYNSDTLAVTNSTLSGNSAGWGGLAGSGGGIYSQGDSSTTTLNNTIVAENTASSGPDVYHGSGMLLGSYNLIGNGSGQTSLAHGESGNQVGTSASPIDARLSDWTELDNGRWGYYLLPDSPALDAGENSLALDVAGEPLIEDISGNPRVQNGTVDLGAMEGGAAAGPGRTYVVASLDMDVAEDGILTFLEAFEAANRNQPVGDAPAGSFTGADVIRFADGLNGTILVENGELVIVGDLSIEGPGAELLAFNAGGTSRVFLINPGVSAGLSGTTITGGSTLFGGGILSYGTLTVTNSTLQGNSAAMGGGICCSGTLTVTDSTLLGNSANDWGGGILSLSGKVTVTDSTLSGNSADDYGGAIYSDSCTLTVTNSTLSGNSANDYGGGVHNTSGTLTVTNSTLSGNSADRGGGIYSSGSSPTVVLNNTLVAGNAAPLGPDIYHDLGSLSGSHNLIGDGTGQSSLVHGIDGNQIGTSASPIDPLLSDWTELANGRWGYYPLLGSPTLDAGENTLAADAMGQPLIEDIYGNPRIQNDSVDIGSVEGATAAGRAQTYVVTSLDRTIAEDGVLTFLEAFEAANRNQPVGDAPAGSFGEPDVIRFAEGLSGTVSVEDGQLTILGDLSIEGPGAAVLAFDAGGESRVFLISPGVSAELSGITITGGSARDGGGICSYGELTVTNSTLWENSATATEYHAHGGGIYSSGTLTVTNSTLSGNSVSGSYTYGGGIYSSGTLAVTNSTLSGNSADSGGGISNYSGTLTVTSSTLSGNWARDGGGICGFGSSPAIVLTNTLVAGNVASLGPDIYLDSGTLSGSYNLIGEGSGQSSLVHGVDGNQIGTSASPINPRLSDWSELGNGRWGYYLLSGSPALDAGENALAVDAAGQPLTEDICGNPRIQNDSVDIGSVEGATLGTISSPGEIYMVTSLDRIVAEDGILTFLEAFEAATRNQPMGDAPAGSFAEPDVIRFADGLSGTVPVEDGQLTILGDLSIEGPGAEFLAFDAGGTSRVFLIGPGVSASLSGMTIMGGSADDGGGIYSSGTLMVTDSTLFGNSADDYNGGAIYNNSGTLTVNNSTLSENSANDRGGGIYSDHGTLTVTNSTLSGNLATTTGNYAYGGGIYSNSGTLTITNSSFSGNSADSSGGGIYSTGTLTVTNSTLSGNLAADSSGGGIYNSGTLTVTNSTLSRNSADDCGGGIYSQRGALTVASSTLAGNSAGDSGGGIRSYSSTLTVTNSTLLGNSAAGYRGAGGAISIDSGTLTVTNSTLSGNSASGYRGSGGGICITGDSSTISLDNTIVAGDAAPSEPDIKHGSGTLTGSYNLIGDGSGQSSLVHDENGNLVGTSESPIDPRFIRNPSDGGDGWGDDPSTPDIDESANDDYGDLRLRPDSPAVDAGDDSLLPADEFDLDADGNTTEPIPFDLAGNTRVLGARVDMGAYEYDPTPPIPGDLDGNGRVDSDDLNIVRAHWGESVTPGSLLDGDPSGDGVVNSADLDIIRANWGQTAVVAGVENADTDEASPEPRAAIGPVPIGEVAAEAAHAREAVFAARREPDRAAWMEAAWIETVERLKTRREVRETRAVDVVLLEWDGR